MNEHDFIVELASSRATSQLPLTALAGSIDYERAALSTAQLEAMLQDQLVSDSASPSAATFLQQNVSRYCVMLLVLGFIIAGLFGAKYIMLPVFQDVYGADSAILQGARLIDMAIWASFVLCPISLLVFVFFEFQNRRAKTNFVPKQVQIAMEEGIAKEKLECAIWLCILAGVLMCLGLTCFFGALHFCGISM